jgi:RHS repeat-associated protein
VITYHAPSTTTSFSFYDKAGRLIALVSPNGIDAFFGNKVVDANFTSNTDYALIDKTTYEYNHLGWLLSSTNTDGGTTNFLYRKDGLIRFSQNAKQAANGYFSYVNYDDIDRVTEAGEYRPAIGSAITFNSNELKALLGTDLNAVGNDTKAEIVYTVYDDIDINAPFDQDPIDVVGKVSTTYKKNFETDPLPLTQTWYNYDKRGRVIQYAQKLPQIGIKRIEYKYDAAGNVQEVAYQRSVANDEFYHFYDYDGNNKLKTVYASRTAPQYNAVSLEITNLSDLTKQAEYTYYLHGPLKSTTIAGTQTIDYTYTIEGLLKAINDPQNLGNDYFAQSIEYYSGDYSKTGVSIGSLTTTNTREYHTGLIKAINWKTKSPDANIVSGAYLYQYDNLYQLTSGTFATLLGNTLNSAGSYAESALKYDYNGNIKGLKRSKSTTETIHDFVDKYNYKANGNQLQSVTGYAFYQYNEIGQMVKSISADLSKASNSRYNASGLLTDQYLNDDPQQPIVKLYYDEFGRRIKKETFNSNFSLSYTTMYMYDVNGSLLAIYDDRVIPGAFAKSETPIYGTERIGMVRGITNEYELKDHLGNVRVTFSTAQLQSYADYFPFGYKLRGQSTNGVYRFGYQGNFSEFDEETKLNSFLLRQYDAVIGRWTSTDPKNQYFSPYVGMGNNPVSRTDPDGGIDDFVFDEGGNYVRTDVKNAPHAIVIENSETHEVMSSRLLFDQVNDYKNLNQAINSGLINQVQSVFNVSKKDVNDMMQGTTYKPYGVRHMYANMESNGGDMDYAYQGLAPKYLTHGTGWDAPSLQPIWSGSESFMGTRYE